MYCRSEVSIFQIEMSEILFDSKNNVLITAFVFWKLEHVYTKHNSSLRKSLILEYWPASKRKEDAGFI